jgi:hypothetical protein
MILPNTIPTRTSEDLNSAADINALMENCQALADGIIDEVRPVGDFYIQFPVENTNTLADAFPEASEPGSMYGGTWSETWGPEGDECDFANEGIFFKTRGDTLSQTDGENNVRTSGLQTDAGQGWQLGASEDTTGARNYYGTTEDRDKSLSSGVGANYTNMQMGTAGQGNVKMLKAMNDGTNGDPRTGKETRGRNRFIKIWRRTA